MSDRSALTTNAITVLESRYLKRDDDNNLIETPDDLFTRVATAVAAAEVQSDQEAWSQRFYDMLSSLEFLPNSPTLMNAGGKGTLSACFVIPVEDTMEGIMKAEYAAAMVQKWGGGTGFALSRLRRQGAPIHSTHGFACGPFHVLDGLNQVSRMITQGGKREGANMAVMRADHPDIFKFIQYKANINRCVACNRFASEHDGAEHNFVEDETAANFNISVGVPNNFFEIDELALVDRKGTDHEEITSTINAESLRRQIAQQAWRTGDPGLIFLERINQWRSNAVPKYGPIEVTNPCGEKPMYPWDSCVLGSIDVSKFVNDDQTFDTDRFNVTVWKAVRFLDNVITVNDYPLPEIKDLSEAIRRIGLGVMGWADLLFKMKIPYNSTKAIELAEAISGNFNEQAFEASVQLAKECGAFPDYQDSIYSLDFNHPHVPTAWQGRPLRNAVRTTIAPTGTISIIAGCSSGIEPAFALAFKRRHRLDRNTTTGRNDWVEMEELNPVLEADLRALGFSEAGIKDIASRLINGDTLRQAAPMLLPDWMYRVYVTASEIAPEWHIRMQAAWQKNTDDAVSKTINLRNDATEEDIYECYKLADELGCLGITVYRDGCRDVQVLGNLTARSSEVEAPKLLVTTGDAADHRDALLKRKAMPRERPALTHKVNIGDVEAYITVGLFEDGSPGEVFMTLSKEGSTLQGMASWATIATSLLLQQGTDLSALAEKFTGMRFDPQGLTDNPSVPFASSIPDYVFKYLARLNGARVEQADGTTVLELDDRPTLKAVSYASLCPTCGGHTYQESGCATCYACGWSKCG